MRKFIFISSYCFIFKNSYIRNTKVWIYPKIWTNWKIRSSNLRSKGRYCL